MSDENIPDPPDKTHIQAVTMQTFASLPTTLFDDVAIGVEPIRDIFERYGYTAETADVFGSHPYFVRYVATRQAELDKEGLTHKLRAGLVADAALAELHNRVRDPSVSDGFVLDTYKAVAKNAGMEPKGADASTGSRFSLQIIIPTSETAPARITTIDVTPDALPYNDAEFEVL